ncbi:MAG: NapC/NirT family cytochrome c [Tepidisphaeraceae bacterium]|jgi:nitrate/TMAO reductase-like tetraheme cytochrome c subunit
MSTNQAERPQADKPQPVVLWTNPITILGLLFVAVGLVALLSFWLLMLFSSSAENNQYLGVFGFMILPGVLINGLILCPVGIVLRRRRLRHKSAVWEISSRHAYQFLAITFFLILPILGVASFRGIEFTDSAEFCGTICHNMDPQYTRYQQSPHARVTCAGCHIGPGPGAFVKAKVSGLRQVYYTALDAFPRPIPPAITELRPARETCEQCHWPSQFFGSLLRRTVHFAPDESNTRHEYEILVKVGGLNNSLGVAEGIHMHMLDRVEYVADDAKLDHVPWVRYTYPDGRKMVFRSDGKIGDDTAPAGKRRLLDCIDCHNVAGHNFQSPERSVDHALAVGQLDASLPFIKRQAVAVLSQNYTTKPQALDAIEQNLASFYRTSYPDIWSNRRDAVDHAVQIVKNIYQTEFFPEMKVDWRTYPNHLGHMESPGCFRCHDGLHIAAGGKRISSDCQTCHVFQYRQPDPKVIVERTFDHPLKINESWKGLGPHEGMLCTDCHDGGLGAVGWTTNNAIYACGDCHPSGRWLEIQRTLRIRRAAATQPSGASGVGK